MANEKIEEITPGAPAAGGNPLIPAIAVLVLMPVLSFALTKFLFIPQIQGAIKETMNEAAGMELQYEPKGAASGHGDAKAESTEKKAKADAHGGGHGGGHGASDAAATPAAPTNSYEFQNIIANLSGSSMNRYVKVSFVVEGESEGFAATIEANRVKLIVATISVLSSLSSVDLQNPGIKNQVRSRLIAAYDSVLRERIVEGLFFSEFVVQ